MLLLAGLVLCGSMIGANAVADPVTSDTSDIATSPSWAVDLSHSDGMVTVPELITMVNVVLGSLPTSACLAGDANGDGVVSNLEILMIRKPGYYVWSLDFTADGQFNAADYHQALHRRGLIYRW